jgi:hypothetical protein
VHNFKDIQVRIDESIESLVGITRAMPGPYLYARIVAHIYNSENSFWERTSKTISRPAFALFTISLMISFNFMVILSVNSFYQIENIQQ